MALRKAGRGGGWSNCKKILLMSTYVLHDSQDVIHSPTGSAAFGFAPLTICGALTMVIMLAIHAGNFGLWARLMASCFVNSPPSRSPP